MVEEITYLDEDQEETISDGFVIDTPGAANWAIRKVKEARTRRDLYQAAAQSHINELQEKIKENAAQCDRETAFLLSALSQYIDRVPAKETKTQKSFLLPDGKLKKKFATQALKPQEDALTQYLAEEEAYIKVIKKPLWGEFKKLLTIVDGKVVRTDTGEVVESVTIEEKPEIFDIE